MSTILVTGSAGFIGSHLCRRLLRDGHAVVGVDHFGPLFFPGLKRERDRRLRDEHPGFTSVEADIADLEAVRAVFATHRPDLVANLAAMTGVRYSVEDPFVYQRSNVQGFLNVLECARRAGVPRVVYASSSSVYGSQVTMPYRETDRADAPISLYAATKRSTELIAHAYASLFGMTLIGLRYFTVYGPWGRPDMAVWSFAERIAAGEPVPVYDFGRMRRDFTFVDDIVEGTAAVLDAPGLSGHEVFNIGAGRCEDLDEVIRLLEAGIGRPAVRQPMPAQPGDVPATWADVSKLEAAVGYRPRTTIGEGIPAFVEWYLANPAVAESVRRERSAL